MHIKIENLSKFYYSATSVALGLQKISLEFGDTGFVAITGESGSGKSTLISVLSGMLSFEEGEIYIDGKPMSEWDDNDLDVYRKNRIGFVFQEYNLIDEYTVFDNVESAIIIRGSRSGNLREYAEEIIKKVGLEEFINQKASKLSSGQKQRLAIARALAKDADVIVADEPTGNLDSENAEKIMELFAEIAKEKLVIMVTHNYDMAQPYVTRQIRLFDGKLVTDTMIEENEASNTKPKCDTNAEIHTVENRSKNKIAWKYTLKNIVRQPVRTMFIATIVLITAILSFVFMGQIISHYDDAHTKIYDNEVFSYEDDKRIIVKKPDGSALTEDDYKKLASLKYVVTVEEYDLCNDIRYASVPGEDYYLTKPTYNLNSVIGGKSFGYDTGVNVSFNKEAKPKYMKSASCITKDDLAEGRLPQERNEIVMYAKGGLESVDAQKIFLQNESLWGNNYYEKDFVVVGILKEKTSQIYFSASFCDMLTAPYKQGEIRLEGAWCAVSKNYKYRDLLIPLINEGVEGKDISLSNYYSMPYDPCKGEAHMFCESVSNTSGQVNIYAEKLLNTGEIESLKYEGIYIGEATEETLSPFVYVSEDYFYELYEKGSHQASLYIEHYAYTDKVLEKLEKSGYDAISSYRVATLEENGDKADNRVRLLLISFAVLIVLAILEVFIVSSFLKLRRKFYSVLKFMGMESGIVKRINFFEINLYTAMSVALTMLLAWIVDMLGLLPWVSEFRVYMDPIHYVIYIIYNFVLAQVVALIHNRK